MVKPQKIINFKQELCSKYKYLSVGYVFIMLKYSKECWKMMAFKMFINLLK